MTRKKKRRILRIRSEDDEDEDIYLSRIEARMTRLALRLDKRRRARYIV